MGYVRGVAVFQPYVTDFRGYEFVNRRELLRVAFESGREAGCHCGDVLARGQRRFEE